MTLGSNCLVQEPRAGSSYRAAERARASPGHRFRRCLHHVQRTRETKPRYKRRTDPAFAPTSLLRVRGGSVVESAAGASSCLTAPPVDRPNRATRVSGTRPPDRVTARDRVATRTLSKLSRRPVAFASARAGLAPPANKMVKGNQKILRFAS